MRIDNYDTTVYKYGIVAFKLQTRDKIRGMKEIDEETLKQMLAEETIIDFDEVDGLTLEELLVYPSVVCKDEIYFVMYDNIPSYSQDNKIRHIIKIPKKEKYYDKPIDEILAESMEKNYRTLSNSARMRTNCFFQRYRYRTPEATQEHIQYLINKR